MAWNRLAAHEDAKFKAGDFVMAKNGRGDCYMINAVITYDGAGIFANDLMYDFDNGAVDVRKRNRSGWHDVKKVDRGYKKVD